MALGLSVGHRLRSSVRELRQRAVDLPAPRHSFELVRTGVLEREAGAGDEVSYGSLHEHLARTCERGDPRPDVDSDPANVSGDLHLAGVDARPHLQPETPDGLTDRLRTPHGPRRPVERRKEAVACLVDLPSAIPAEERPHRVMVTVEERPPVPISHLRDLCRRPDDVCEQDRGEDTVERGLLLPQRIDEPLQLHDSDVDAPRFGG